MRRRHFFTAAAAGVATVFRGDSLLHARAALETVSGRAADSVARDEDFWLNVRHAFTVDRNMINLNNGGVSPAPKIVMDTEMRYLEVENMSPSYYMWNVSIRDRDGTATAGAVIWMRSGRNRDYPQCERVARDRAAWDGVLKRATKYLTTNQDYPRMITTWQQRERRDGIVLKQITFPVPPPSFDYLAKRIEDNITPQTKVIHICHITNRTGQIFPVKKICQMARARGIEVVVDGAHAFGQFPIQHEDLDCDY